MKNYLAKTLLITGFYPLCILVVMWGVFFIDYTFHLNIHEYGVLPRTLEGTIGILFSPFIHGNIEHIASNSLPTLILGMMLFYFYKPVAIPAVIWIYIISGIWLWIGGRNSDRFPTYHIGMSGVIYGMASFLIFSGIFRKHYRLMTVSALVVFLYGSMTYNMFPFEKGISWEAHLFGAIAGLMVAYNYRKEGPQRKTYDWENEDDNDTTEPYWQETSDEETTTNPPNES